MSFHQWLSSNEGIWLFYVLAISITFEVANFIVGLREIYWAKKEYEYDEAKDIEKKQRRTRTTKKTTTQPGGGSITEESTETVEPAETQGEKK